MLGAIFGDIVGSRFEFEDHYGKAFALFTKSCKITDDSLMTIAIAKAILECDGNYANLGKVATKHMAEIGRANPDAGFGSRFWDWICKRQQPMNSFGNGAGMRISPVGWVAQSEDQVKTLAKAVTEVSHNHPEGLKGAECIAMAVFWAKQGKSKEFMREKLSCYYSELKDPLFTINNLMGCYGYDASGLWVTCQGSVPQAILAFLEGNDFEDVVRNAVGLGGDSDTLGAMAGSIAEAYYGIPDDFANKALAYLAEEYQQVCKDFYILKDKLNNK